MKIFKKILSVCLTTLLFTSSYSQNIETRNLPAFNKISLKDNTKLTLHIGTAQSVKVESDDLSDVRTVVSGSKLSVSGSESTIEITIPELTNLDISGSSKVIADSIIKTQSLRLSISGNGKINMPVEVSQLEIEISGNGKLELSGNADFLDIDISGNGKIEGRSLSVNSCEASISGIGKCNVDVKNNLKLDISGSGSFYYSTKPASLETSISGIGKYGIINEQASYDNDSTTAKSGNKRVIIIGNEKFDFNHDDNDSIFHKPSKAKSHWAGIEFGFNSFAYGKQFETTNPKQYDFLELNSGKSINVNLNFFAHDFQLYKRNVLFTTGLGLTINNFRFNSNQTLRSDTNIVTAALDYDNQNKPISYSKNKLALTYVTVPLLLQFNTHQEYRKSFHFATGILLSYKLNSHLKLVYSEDGSKHKDKRQDEFNIEPFRYDATFRIGYQNYTLYASYALSELFKDNRGPEVHPFQFGINILGW